MIDFQGLLKVLKAGEDNPNILMKYWDCGTSQCLIGSFCKDNVDDKLSMYKFCGNYIPALNREPFLEFNGYVAISVRFNITEKEANWLFIKNPYGKEDALDLDKERALARLRKFIYYKLHKQEMIIETGRNGQVVNLGRNISGTKSALLAQVA